MGILDKIASLINGNPTTSNIKQDLHSSSIDPLIDSVETNYKHTDLLNENEDVKDNLMTSDTDKYNTFINGLHSKSSSQQRYVWHEYLLSLLKDLKPDNKGRYKYFRLCILKESSYNYSWCDEAFNKELCQDLRDKGLGFIGSSSFSIELTPEKIFNTLAKKEDSDSQIVHNKKNILFVSTKTASEEQRFTTAIDKRTYVIREFIKKFSDSVGTDSDLMENLVIIVIRNEEDEDMSKYNWLGKRFEDDLKRELANAFLEKIGSKSIQVILKPKSEAIGCTALIDNQVYYSWSTQKKDNPTIPQKKSISYITVLEGTGSLAIPLYTLGSNNKSTYHIGRGKISRKSGYRINDIVIKDDETDSELLLCNGHVSSAHADIVLKNNKYYLRASVGGCRTTGGSPTKIVRNKNTTELRDTSLLYPLEDGDIIELGKSVLLQFTLSSSEGILSNKALSNR